MLKKIFCIAVIVGLNNSVKSQEISSTATTTIVEFTSAEGYNNGNYIANQAGWSGSSNWKSAQAIFNDANANRITVKRQWQRSQKNEPLQANIGEIITLQMVFKPKCINLGCFDNIDGELFAFGLKSVFDISDTQPANTNGELIAIEIDANSKVGIKYKVDDATQAYTVNNWKTLTIKYFVGNSMGSSYIKAKLDHGSGNDLVSSGWVDQEWDSQSLYDAIITTGAYMVFQSNTGLGTETADKHLYIDSYTFHTDDPGQIFVGGGIAQAASWSGGTVPSSIDRIYIINKNPNWNNGGDDYAYDYIYVDFNSTLSLLHANSVTVNDIDLDGTLIINKFANNNTIENNITVNNDLNVNSTLTIDPASSLKVTGNFTNNGTVTLNSDADEFASIIVGGTSSGDIIYNRYVNTQGTDDWDLIGAPVDGLSINSFVTTNSSPLAASGSTYAVGVYDNSNDSWTNYTSSTVGAAGNFDIGKGYQMATSSGATMAFTGTIATTDQTQSIINNAGSGGRRWNLVANPYPSYLNANTNAHATNNFLSVNSGVIDGSYLALYGYDADGSGYTIYNNTTSATYIAPGQAFFVAAASSSAADLSFTEAMQTTTGGDDFIAGRLANTSSEFYLKLYEDEEFIADTKFYFDNDLSLGLDPGYDAGAYNQSSALASRLVENDQGIAMGINAMNVDSFEETTIPLVVNRAAGTSFRISLEDLTIPESVEVFLEDTETQNFTNLRTEDFILTPDHELSGMGRFYLRLGNTNLGGEEVEESYVSIYKSKLENYITIEGLSNVTMASVKLYNLLGQELLSQTLETNISTQKIPTERIPTGVYVINLSVNGNTITKKIIIN